MTDIVSNATGTPGHSMLRIDYKIVLNGSISVLNVSRIEIRENMQDFVIFIANWVSWR